ncbi:MAG: hypothetical protein J7K04_10940 [Spirochaetales bacterium]|nr:hypothetical protein [Spirochaetales bacterium]
MSNQHKSSDVKVKDINLYFIPVNTRIPLKFGSATLTHATCARVCMHVNKDDGKTGEGWGETPLSVNWAWPSSIPYKDRENAVKEFCILLASKWKSFNTNGHPMEIGYSFINTELSDTVKEFNKKRDANKAMPWLAALVCCSAFDIALHDAYGNINGIPIYESYNAQYMNADLSVYLEKANESDISFKDKYPEDYFVDKRQKLLPAWHLVGGKDLIKTSELTGKEPNDGYPVLLEDWIKRDGLKCLKIKLRGNDFKWDMKRLVEVGNIAIKNSVNWISSDFNCTVKDVQYVNDILDNLMKDYPRIYGMLLYVEQPFPYDLESNKIDVHSISSRKPLFMDESAHDWRFVKIGRSLGWTGVALKTCKTQTGALLSLAWAKAHGMGLMVQDLTNPMLAQIPHVLLAQNAGTIMGVETNSMQFYPDASLPEEAVHPGIYRRRNGVVDLSSIHGNGFGYRLAEIKRKLPDPVII